MHRLTRTRGRQPRPGVILLVVLSLLALFTLLVVTFVVLAGAHRDAAESAARRGRYEEDPARLIDMAAYQLLRGTRTNSSLQDHSLLDDLYSTDGLKGVVQASSTLPNTEQQWIGIDFTPSPSQPFAGSMVSNSDDYYCGCVITMLTGASKGKSSRIVRYEYIPANTAANPPTPERRRLFIDSTAGSRHGDFWPVNPGDTFLLNGAPFNGTGHGYNPATTNIDQIVPLPGGPALTSLLPHFAAYSQRFGLNVNQGGADESWDTWDYQNMFLAKVPVDPAAAVIPSFHRPSLIHFWMQDASRYWHTSADFRRMVVFRPLPSDHPNFTGSNKYLAGSNLDFDLHILGLKRNRADVPATQGPPTMELELANYWDVDNDGDGVPDSVWLDLGLPAKTSQDGRLYKPLFAILVKDLDGRLNLNAHSNFVADPVTLASTFRWHPGPDAHWGRPFVDDDGDGTVDNSTEAGWSNSDDIDISQVTYLTRGQGIGPADISLAPVVTRANVTPATLTQILRERVSDRQNSPGAGVFGVNDFLSAIKHHQWDSNYGLTRTGFSSPPDSRGIGALALDHYGQPVFAHQPFPNVETIDDPYEVPLNAENAIESADPFQSNSSDRLFTLADLEAILRYYDVDARRLSPRLSNHLGTAAAGIRELVTTHSSHIAAPRTAVLPELRSTVESSVVAASARLLDVYRAKLASNGLSPAQIEQQLTVLVPFEIRRGQLFDLNRPFGNGRDDNGNNVVDEPLEALGGGELAWTDSAVPASFRTSSFDYRNEDPLIVNPLQNYRQIYARHLYCMAMLVVDQAYVHPVNGSTSPPNGAFYTAKRIAQWAVNVVDFRDPDAIMTPFEFDPNPFDGWGLDGWIGMGPGPNGTLSDGDDVDDGNPSANGLPERPLVWGVEQPDLLLTETTAFHDRRVKDTDYDNGISTKDQGEGPQQLRTDDPMDDPMMPEYDGDLDQYRIPEGSLFLELYCPRNYADLGRTTPQQQLNNLRLPAELYDFATGQLDLGRLAPERQVNGRTTRHPVWRIVVSNPGNDSPDRAIATPGTAEDSRFPHPSTTEFGSGSANDRRIIWLTPYVPNNDLYANYTFYQRGGTWDTAAAATVPAGSNVLLPAARYAVVGPRDTTYIGSQQSALNTYFPSSQGLGLAGGTFSAWSSGAVYPSAGAGMQIQRPVGIICAADRPNTWTGRSPIPYVGVNVSEPLPNLGNYYPEPNPNNDGRIPPDAYANFTLPYSYSTGDHGVDNFLDDEPLDNSRNILPQTETRTYQDFRTAYLQRLADPTLAWNPYPGDTGYNANLPLNPYITVDWATIDLTVFSGDENTNVWATPPGAPREMDPDDYNSWSNNDEFLIGRERGQASQSDRNIWSPLSDDPADNGSRVANESFANCFPRRLVHTFGYLNHSHNALGTFLTPPVPGFEGAADKPFPWLTHFNRPFANPFELLFVPASSPARLCYEISGPKMYSPHAYLNPGLPPTPPSPYTVAGGQDFEHFRAPFGHLLNFFHTGLVNQPGQGGNFYRLLDLVEVPSPYVATETWYKPSVFSTAPEARFFRPPMNRISRFRDPGRVNVNTVLDTRVFEGLVKNFPAWDPTIDPTIEDQVALSRRGFLPETTLTLQPSNQQVPLPANAELHKSYPTRVANPIRSAMSGDLMPPVQDLRKTGVEATLLRNAPSGTSPLFSFEPTTQIPHADSDRNAYFRYQGLARLSNLLSTNSNVFAVWITVGFFELEPNPVDPMTNSSIDFAHPDGYRLSQELDSDRGLVKRHRGFYIIDRSIPVAFEPDENHNVDRAILLRRLIE